LPTALRVIAYATIFFGVCSVIHVITALFRNRLDLNLGVLQIPAGFGLLRLSRGWRTFKLVVLWIAFIAYAVAAAVLAVNGFRFTLFRRAPSESLQDFMIILAVPLLAYMIWEYRFLTSPAIRRLFGLSGS
jgi:hypothetical protein